MLINHCVFLAKANQATNIPLNNASELNHLAENTLLQTAFFFKIAIEYFALLILALGIVRAISRLLAFKYRKQKRQTICSVRLDLGRFLILSLEFLLAADIAATAVSPSWEAIGKLAAISGIRTFLNYFLQKEVQELEHLN